MSKFEFLKNIKIGRPTVGQMIFCGITLALSVTAFIFISNLTQCWTLTGLPGIPPASCGEVVEGSEFTVDEQGNPITLPPTPLPVAENLPPAWDGASRINILFMGMDARDLEENNGPPRTDSMILFTIDPITKTGGMLSIPRDMWVNVPGFGYSRINTAYPSGEGAQLPGGGPGLAMQTVSQFIGVPVDYYVQVDFVVFETMVNEIIKIGGCLQVYPTEKMILDPIGPGLDKVKLTTGGYRDLCDGWKVLAYARNRKTSGGDADRARRQQEVIFALQKIIFTPENFPKFIQSSTALYKRLSWGIKTNLAFDDAVKLGVLGMDIPRENIKTGVIDPQLGMAVFDNTTLGGEDASVLKPITEQIRILRDEIFTVGGALSPIAQGDAATLMREEGSRVRIMDGTYSGLDQRAGAVFQSYGMNITEVAQSPEAYSSTVVILYGPDVYTIRWLQSTFGIADRQIRFQPDPNSTVDVEIRLGSDIAGSFP